MKPNELDEKYKEAIRKNARVRENLVYEALGDHGIKQIDLDRMSWSTEVVKGAQTLMFDDTPIITLFPVETNMVHKDDGTMRMEIEQKYLKHKKEEDG